MTSTQLISFAGTELNVSVVKNASELLPTAKLNFISSNLSCVLKIPFIITQIPVPELSKRERFKLYRNRMKLTQKDVAQKLGFSLAFYQLWETGKRNSSRLEKSFTMLINE